MVSKGQIKLITSLAHKKYRDKTGLFVAEGPKVVKELLAAGYELSALYATEQPFEGAPEFHEVSDSQLQKISSLKHATSPIGLFNIPSLPAPRNDGLILALDAVRDPGNLGTIIRLCDWFGIEQIWCTGDTVDCYNPKVVQATMGSIARLNVHYLSLGQAIKESGLPVYGAFMDGEIVYDQELPEEAILVMGNEGKGISEALAEHIENRISIPRHGQLQKAESLNVATATAILLNEISQVYWKVKLIKTPRVDMEVMLLVHGLFGSLSGTSSSLIANTPRIDGVNLKK